MNCVIHFYIFVKFSNINGFSGLPDYTKYKIWVIKSKKIIEYPLRGNKIKSFLQIQTDS
jgi:hypothetical protein